MCSKPAMTASLSVALRRYGAVATRVLSCGVISSRPRDMVPVPRYCVIVMEAAGEASVHGFFWLERWEIGVNEKEKEKERGDEYCWYGLQCGLAIEWSVLCHRRVLLASRSVDMGSVLNKLIKKSLETCG